MELRLKIFDDVREIVESKCGTLTDGDYKEIIQHFVEDSLGYNLAEGDWSFQGRIKLWFEDETTDEIIKDLLNYSVSKTLEERIELAKKEILIDIKNGTIPKSVSSFSELHDYVDANYYGGLCDMDYEVSEDWKDENYIQGEIDNWIKSIEFKLILKTL